MNGFNWLEELSPLVRDAMLAKAKVKALPDGTTISHQGDPATEVWQIVRGEIRQCILTEDGQEVLMYIYQPGDLVGDTTVSGGILHSVTLVTKGQVKLRAWSAKDFSDLKVTYAEIGAAVTEQFSRRLLAVIRILEELLTQPVAARIASRIFWLSNMQCVSEQQGMLSISQADLGLMVGSTRQSVNRVVTELRNLKLIETVYGKVMVKDRDGLKRYISEHQRLARACR
ncbi:Crp/Fnr family transcriptional regulator [Pseudomonas aeruginosa]